MATRARYYSWLPEELVIEILSRLPVESLVRFKLVCKLWRSIISDNQFIQTHLTNSHKNKIFVLNYRPKTPLHTYIEVHDTHQDSVKPYHLPPTETDTIKFVDSCNGLVCLSDGNMTSNGGNAIYIWNPATKRFKLLPTPNKDYSSKFRRVRDGLCQREPVFLGLGFDPISNDYKLLRIVFNFISRLDDPQLPEAEMYSANTDSWKEIQISEKSLTKFWTKSKFHAIAGVLYMEGRSEILAFDLHTEVVRVYPFPSEQKFTRSNVLDYEGYVAMVFESADGSVSLYQLDHVCAEVSWTKMFNLEAGFEIIWVSNYSGKGQFVVLNSDSYCIFDYKKREYKTTLLQFPYNRQGWPVNYIETLVSLEGFEQQKLIVPCVNFAALIKEESLRKVEALKMYQEWVYQKNPS